MITLKKALSKMSWNVVKDRLVNLYPDQECNIEGYERAFEELQTLTPTPNPDRIRICVKWVPPYPKSGGDFYDVFVYNPRKKKDYAPSFYSWEDWLGFFIAGKQKMPILDVVCHVLYEMTYHGFSRSKVEEKQNRIASAFEKAFRSMALGGNGE